MTLLQLHLLGTFEARLAGEPLTRFRSDKIRALLAFLAVSGDRPHPRDTLATLLWSEYDERAAKGSLRQALSNLRQMLAPLLQQPDPILVITRQTVTFCASHPDVWIDAVVLQDLVQQANQHAHDDAMHCDQCRAWLTKAAALYHGDFLMGLQTDDSPAFSEWRLLQQEQLHQKTFAILSALADSYEAANQWEQQSAYLHQQLQLAPWHESTHYRLMQVFAQAGQQAQALTQYRLCRRVLTEELGVEPSAETTALFHKLQAAEVVAQPSLQAKIAQHNLPPPATPFVGRAEQLQSLCRQLLDPDERLVTITGMGGMGKTRLAQAVAHQVLAQFPQGVWFVPLANLDAGLANEADGGLQQSLAAAVLARLGASMSGAQDPMTRLLDYLRAKKLLLILDNLEHLLPDATAFVLELLQNAPALTILGTSQVRLRCRAESLLPLAGLELPAATAASPLEADSVKLFIGHARRRWPEFQPDAATTPELIAICRLLNGVPLALELAAALVGHYTLADIKNAIGQNLDLLDASWHDLPGRQRSIRAVFDYAWQLMSPAERQMLAQVSLFQGTFGREAALAVTDGTLMDLVALVDKSFLRLDRPGRYALHQLVRQFAEEALTTSPDIDVIWARYGRYYAGLVRRYAGLFEGPAQPRALVEMRQEIDNIRQAWRWLTAQGETSTFTEMLNGLSRFYNDQGWYQEGLDVFATAVTRLTSNVPPVPKQMLARLKCWQARFLQQCGRYQEARALLEHLLPDLRAAQWDDLVRMALASLGFVASEQGDMEQARQWLEEALVLSEAATDQQRVALVLDRLGRYWEVMGQYDQAGALMRRSVAHQRRIGRPRSLAMSLGNLGRLLHRLGENQQAQALLQEAVDINRELGHSPGVAGGLANLGLVLTDLQAYDEAKAAYQEALQIQENEGNRTRIAIILNNLGDIANQQGAYPEALANLEESLHIKEAMGNERGMMFSQVHLGHTYLGLAKDDLARQYFVQALALAQKLAVLPLTLAALVGLAQCIARDDPEQALALLQLPIHHPASWQRIREEGIAVATTITSRLTPAARTAAVQSGQSLDLEEVATRFLNAERPF